MSISRDSTYSATALHSSIRPALPRNTGSTQEPVFSLNRLWDLMIAQGRAYGITHPGQWCDVGRPDCIPLAQALLDG